MLIEMLRLVNRGSIKVFKKHILFAGTIYAKRSNVDRGSSGAKNATE